MPRRMMAKERLPELSQTGQSGFPASFCYLCVA
jgi:hypothetical protein